jgi:hypothetical protein
VFSPVSFNCVVVMIVAAHGNRSMNAYIHAPLTIHGPQITNLGLMDIKGWAVSDASLDLCRRLKTSRCVLWKCVGNQIMATWSWKL